MVSYILSLEKNSNNSNQGGIAMAQPQLAEASLYQGATPIGQPLSSLFDPKYDSFCSLGEDFNCTVMVFI